MLRLRRARTRIALLGALVSMTSLALVAVVTASFLHRVLAAQVDEELDTLVEAIGSDLELRGLTDLNEDTLRQGIESNVFEFRLEHHSAILFRGNTLVARTGDLPRVVRASQLADLARRGPQPFTAIEEFTGQRRVCRFQVARLSGRAAGATLVVFRSIAGRLWAQSSFDHALAVLVALGTLASGLILVVATRQALLPVERITAAARDIGAHDLTRRVPVGRGAQELTRLAEVINDLLGRVEHAFASQRRLTADAAHELKTPVAVIVVEAQEALRAAATSAERASSLQTVLAAAHGLAQGVDDLLALARWEAGLPGQDETLVLQELVVCAVDGVRSLAAAKGIGLRVVGNGGEVTGDRAGLTRMLANLVKNAVQYSPLGTEVEVASGREGEVVWLEVLDRGPGIPEADRARVFERFARLPDGRTTNPHGAGLGLAIAAEVVRNHAGRILVRGRTGGGTILRVELPNRAPRPEQEGGRGAARVADGA